LLTNAGKLPTDTTYLLTERVQARLRSGNLLTQAGKPSTKSGRCAL
jgi:hypothetical protein